MLEAIIIVCTILGGIAAVFYFIDKYKKKRSPTEAPVSSKTTDQFISPLTTIPSSEEPSRLHQLPADLADFTGREEEVEELLAVLRGGEGKAAISALGGMGGVGKTALAVHAAHKLMPDYPEAQIVMDLLGTSENPLSPEAAMGNVIKAFHPEAHLPESPRDMRGLYHSVLAGKRALILLDNAVDEEQVESLAPSPPCE